jgi:dTDP-L-rhamnose 4-epimerase
MKILITGGAGFVGSHLADKLIKEGHKVFIFDLLDKQVHPSCGWPSYLHKDAEHILGDVRKQTHLSSVIIGNGIDVIYHFAAKVGVGQSMYEIKDYVDVNVGGTANLLNVLANEKHSVKKLIIASSMSCYGEGSYFNLAEGTLTFNGLERKESDLKEKKWDFSHLNPVATREYKILEAKSIYALTKKMQEEMCLSIGKAYNIPTVALRFFNIYGTRQALSNPYTGVAAIFCGCYLDSKKPMIFEDGRQTRDFIHVSDVVEACYLAMIKEKANNNIYNVGSGHWITVWELAKLIQKEMKSDLEPEVTHKYRVGDIRHCFASIDKIQQDLGFDPKIEIQNGIPELIEWVKQQTSSIDIKKMKTQLDNKNLIL